MKTGTLPHNEQEQILSALVEGVVIIDDMGVIQYTNQAFAKMMGLSRRELCGQLMSALSPPNKTLLSRCLALMKLSLEQNTAITDSIALEDKRLLDLIALPQPFQSGVSLVIQDKSSQRQVSEMGKEFIANASHELRTPITIIKGFAETLQDIKDISPSMLAEIIEKIVRNCARMDTLIKNLLTLADLENIPQGRFKPCDLVLLASNCQHLLQTLSPEAQIDIDKTQDHIIVHADPDLLELAIMNLLENGGEILKLSG